MKTKLDELTVAEFIGLVCGDKDVLLGKHEMATPGKVMIAMRNIVMEYRAIADPGGNAAYLRKVDALLKARVAVAVYSMCRNLVLLECHEKAREVLVAAGLHAGKYDEKRIGNEVHIRLEKARRAYEELDAKEDEGENEDIRNSFNAMIAAMMAHFKFQIEPATMAASVFAHLVARYHTEIKALKNALKRR